MIFVGVDWSEQSHAVCVLDEGGAVLERATVPDGPEGLRWIHEVVAKHGVRAGDVFIGIEIDHGLMVEGLHATGYQVYPVNPYSASRYRDRDKTSGQKSDSGDARMLADLVRTDRHKHQVMASNSEGVDALKALTRTHQQLIEARVRHSNELRMALREYYPAAIQAFSGELRAPDTLELLGRAPTPLQGRRLSLSRISAAMKRANRRNVEDKAAAIQAALRAPQLERSPLVARAYGQTVSALVRLLESLNAQIEELEQQIAELFQDRPEAKLCLSLPGLGNNLGPRALAEFGDSPGRYRDSKARRAFAGTAPVTCTSGKSRWVHRRYATNRRLLNTCQMWAFGALRGSPGAHAYYRHLRLTGKSHNAALRQLANRLVAIFHGCLENGTLYDESIAWKHWTLPTDLAA